MRLATLTGGLLVLTFACTNDYDQFNFGGAQPTGGTTNTGGTTVNTGGMGSGGGGAPSTGGMGSGGTPSTGGMGSGGTPSTGGMGGMGGSPPVVEVPCGDGVPPCDIGAGESCCIDNNGASGGTCKSNCQGNEAALDCNEPADCPGQLCCLEAGGGDVSFSRCEDSCSDETICDPANPDCGGNSCVQHPDMPPGYFYCD